MLSYEHRKKLQMFASCTDRMFCLQRLGHKKRDLYFTPLKRAWSVKVRWHWCACLSFLGNISNRVGNWVECKIKYHASWPVTVEHLLNFTWHKADSQRDACQRCKRMNLRLSCVQCKFRWCCNALMGRLDASWLCIYFSKQAQYNYYLVDR